jgi:hypothetical protein
MAPLTPARFAGVLGVAALAACTGQLGAPSGPAADVPLTDGDPSSASDEDVTGADQPLTVKPQVVGRLSRLEYDNTVRDLLGTALTPAREFPADGTAEGFDTVGSALSISPLHVVAYERAAHELVAELFSADSEARRRIVHCDVEQGSVEDAQQCARAIVGDFARRAFRRPVTADEVDGLLAPLRVAQEVGATRTEGIRHSLAAVLISPFFLFKVEMDDDPASTQPRRLGAYELASRLSYALWSTLPDDVLLAAAESGELTSDAGLSAQIDRMLADPRSDMLLRSFAGRWLEFEELETHEVSADVFPEYGPDVARGMKLEAQHFFRDFLHSDRHVEDMLSADFTYADAPLASYYGLARDGGEPGDFVRVDTAGSERTGLLTLGALLTVTSFSSRTSVVRRGEFLFSRLLCQHVPPPPPGVEGISMDGAEGLTLRQRLERHRADPDCKGCHTLMDPLGFGLESFDAIGRHRTHEGSLPIDATGVMPNGTRFDGAAELSQILGDDPKFTRCVTKKFFTYAGRRLLGAGDGASVRHDEAWVEHVAAQADAEGGSLRSIIRAVLLSEPFRSRVPSES